MARNRRLHGRRSAALALLLLAGSRPQLDAKVESYWEKVPPLSTPRQEVGVAAHEHYVYVIGGILENTSPTGLVERFDTRQRQWETVAPLPDDTALHHVGAAATWSHVYAVGGLNDNFRGVDFLFAFDPLTGMWERRAPLPWPRGAQGVASDGERVYAAGGQDGGTSFADFAVYVEDEDRWYELPAVPTARNHLAAVCYEGRFYAAGGRAGGLRGAFEVFDPRRREWAELPEMITPRAGIAASVVLDRVYVFGGEGNPDDPAGIFPQVEAYFPCLNRWFSDVDMRLPRHGIGAAMVDGAIYVPGGAPVEGFATTAEADVFYAGTVGPGRFEFLRGDANVDGEMEISDSISIFNALFLGGTVLHCEDAADVNDDSEINISDGVFGLNFLFLGGPEPPFPGADAPGFDPTDDRLSCDPTRPRPCFDPFP